MNVGMLWFDNDPHTALMVKVARAADYYRRKYGHMPDKCLVHPSMLAELHAALIDDRFGKVVIRSSRAILPGHLWIGVEEKPDSVQSKKNPTQVESPLFEGSEDIR